MARKTSTFVVQTDGRDKGKLFHITEMSAEQAEDWGIRLMLALAKAGVEVQEGFFELGMAGVAAMGIRAMGGLPFEIAKPLMNEMMACLEIQPEPENPRGVRRRVMMDTDIEEVATRVMLKEAVLTLHTGFSAAAFLSNYLEMVRVRAAMAVEKELGGDTPTSEEASPSLSEVALPD